MLATDVPYLVDITIDKEANVLPMVEPGSSVSDVRLTN
jgi:thiamine pyrophosphate-dependent acetolactate synthase large subunit-like protein